MVFGDAVVLAGSSIEAVANTQSGREQGASQFITDLYGELDGLDAEGSPSQVAVTWGREHKSHTTGHKQELVHSLYIILQREHSDKLYLKSHTLSF